MDKAPFPTIRARRERANLPEAGKLRLAAAYEQHEAKVRAYARRFFPNNAAATDDIVQDTFYRLIPLVAKDAHGQRDLFGFVMRAARSARIDYLRRTCRHRSCSLDQMKEQRAEGGTDFEPASKTPPPEEHAEWREELELVREAATKITGNKGRAMCLLLDGKSKAEMSQELGIPPKRLKELLSESRRILRGQFPFIASLSASHDA